MRVLRVPSAMNATTRPFGARWVLSVALIALFGLLAAACAGDDLLEPEGGTAEEEPEETGDAAAEGTDEAEPAEIDVDLPVAEGPEGELVISIQPGIGYASMIVMEQEGWLEQALPNMEIGWEELASGAAIRDAILAGDVHIGTGGVGPFYVGWDAGVGYRILSSMNNMDLWLMTTDDSISSLADFGSGDRIAMPAPDSIQSVHLRRAAQEELGDPNALDASIVALPHPDGVAALLAGQISAHLTSPPFQFQLRDEGAEKILGSFDLWGESTFNTVYTTEQYYEENREAMDVLYQVHEMAVERINEDPEWAAELLSQHAGGDPDADQFLEWVQEDGLAYTTVPEGVLETGQFMAEIGMIDQEPQDLEEILFDAALEAGGN